MEVATSQENSAPVTGNRENEESGSGFREEGNRWPQQETLALLKIRSDMDVVFRDSNNKASLWEEVSRKMSELGHSRSAKKCKEKFENIYKYHRRTKEGRSVKQNGKTYKYFEQLEALDSSHAVLSSSSQENVQSPLVASTSRNPMNTVLDTVNIGSDVVPCPAQSHSMNVGDDTSNSSASASSRESERTRNKKRKLMEFFAGLMREVIEKQENLQKKFLETLERCEQERMAREEAWKKQELDRIKRERELLAQERSMAAAKDTAVLSFLQKFLGQGSNMQLLTNQIVPVEIPKNQTVPGEEVAIARENRNVENFSHMSSSRWPKEEIECLIQIRSNLESQYQDNGPKGPLWEEISSLMKKHGYNRSAKRCKEKWENMNKYFKRVKDSNKKRPDDAKTCPYFHQLDALYKEKTTKVNSSANSHHELKPEELLLHMMAAQEEGHQHESATTEDGERESADQSQEQEDHGEKHEDSYHIVSNVSSSVAIMQ